MTTAHVVGPPRLRRLEETSVRDARRRLLRVAWLQHRGACLALLAVFAVFVIAIVLERTRVDGSYAAFVADGCVGRQLTPGTCNTAALALGGQSIFTTLGVALSALPLLVGVFVGAPLVSREIESGTFRFAWTQATPRSRLVFATLGVLAGGAAGMAAGLGLLFGGWYAHVYYVVLAPLDSQWQVTPFATTWWLLSVWTVSALVISALVGTIIRRTVAAMAATAALVGGLIYAGRVVLPEVLHVGASTARLQLHSAVEHLVVGTISAQSQPGWHLPPGSWLLRSWMTGPDGRVLGRSASVHVRNTLSARTASGAARWLAVHHDAFWVSYQPPSHFWMLQGAEGVVLLAVATLCALATTRMLKRRAAA
jgi:hypothetical protein